MRIVIGLGNPEERYKNTRHNAGFRIVDALAKELQTNFSGNNKFFSEIAETTFDEDRLILAKPQTFMNDSGKAVAALTQFYKISNPDLLIVHDEIDLPLGTIRLSKNSGSAGHKGAESIIAAIGRDLNRLRIGIDNRASREQIPTDDYVLQDFTQEEEGQLKDEVIPKALQQIKGFLKNEN